MIGIHPSILTGASLFYYSNLLNANANEIRGVESFHEFTWGFGASAWILTEGLLDSITAAFTTGMNLDVIADSVIIKPQGAKGVMIKPYDISDLIRQSYIRHGMKY